MGISEVKSPWSSHRADSVPGEPTASFHSEPGLRPEPHGSDTEGEQQASPLPPLEEEPTPSIDEEPMMAKGDADVGSGQDLGCANPEHLRQFEQLMGMKVFRPDVPGASMGVIGPDE
jgi:hypothetical protein